MLKEWLRQYTPQGRTVFMTSHVLETVERHSLVIRSLWGTSDLNNSPAALCGAFRGMGFQPMRGGEAQPPPCGCPSSSRPGTARRIS